MKQVHNIVKTAFRSILKNRLRSLLTSLGIIIGVSSVIVMVAFGQGTQNEVESKINSLGTNLLMVMPGSANSGGVRMGAASSKGFTFDEIELVRNESILLSNVSASVRAQGQIIGGGNNWNTDVYGVDTSYLSIRNYEIEYGEFIEYKDISAKRKVAVIGATIAEELFETEDPTGMDIRIKKIPFEIIGVLKEKGQSGMGKDQDDLVLVPSTTALYRLKGVGQNIDMIYASAVSAEKMDQAKEEIEVLLREDRNIYDSEDDDFRVVSQSEITEAITSTTETFTILLGSIAAVSLLVGGIGIMNIMLVSVTERTREIGIRLSIGAFSSDILIQFLTEAVVLSLSGGFIGILISFGAVALINNYSSFSAVINTEVVILSVLFSVAVGIFFGFYPARKAANLNPIDALRYE